jgi:hypothetical protein
MLTRVDLAQLAAMRLEESRLLLENGLHSGAYYLAGYAAELALKVPIAAKFAGNEIPDRSFVNAIYTHDLEKLITHAGLLPALRKRQSDDIEFATNWEVVKNWNEGSRYRVMTEEEAKSLFEALSHPNTGVFPWIQMHW